jgi:hypothetical protein
MTMLSRLRYIEWTFSNTCEAMTGLLLALVVGAALLG